ncbi:MAG: DUF4249 domain-containing protein [Bacteroidetes bacterium]|nr:DUF4249 domain-containing protein [Bacteroidota bacterium]
MLIIWIALGACIEKFNPNIMREGKTYLVVDGSISNKGGPYEVKLSVSSPIQSPEFIPYPNARLTIIEENGLSETLTETAPGIYTTSENGMQGIIGRKYKLIINTPDEKEYESAYQLLREPVEIERVYAESRIIQTENDYYPDYGVQFYVDTELAESDTNYLLWQLYGTYKYQTDFLIRFIYDNHQLDVFPRSDSLQTCYGKDNISSLFTMDTEGLVPPRIDRFPLNFVNTTTRKLSMRYSLLAKQMTLNKESFMFYSELKDIVGQHGSLYSQQPYQLRGNVFNKANPDEVVLGYFLVCGEAEQRVFIDRPADLLFHYDICTLNEADYWAYAELYLSVPALWPLYVTTDGNQGRAVPNQDCVDCRRMGGTVVKPDYWED